MGRPREGQAVFVRGRWVARVRLTREPPGASGRARYADVVALGGDGAELTRPTKEARAAAKRYAARLQTRYDDGTWSPPGRGEPATLSPSSAPTLTWVTAWLAKQTYSSAHMEQARTAAWLPRTRLATIPLGQVTARDVATFLGELRELPSATGRRPAERTVRNIFDAVARALRAAVFEGHLAADPTSVLPSEVRPKAVDVNPAARRGYRLSRAEVEALLRATTDRMRIVWHVLAFTGMRESEFLALTWGDILDDRPLRRVLITKQIHYRTRKVAPLKTRDTREVPEHPSLRRELEAWRLAWAKHFKREPAAADLILPTWGRRRYRGALVPLWSAQLRVALKPDLATAGVKDHRVHDLRHTFASLCADAGMRENVAARWTHTPQGKDARHLYAVPSWPAQCAEMQLLKLSTARPSSPRRAVG